MKPAAYVLAALVLAAPLRAAGRGLPSVERFAASARTKAPPLIATATNALVHSSRLRTAATTLGTCSTSTNKPNIIPSNSAARRAALLVAMPVAAAMNAAPTTSSQNKCQGIHEGISVARKPG